jgi:hypothetical protein
MSFGVYRAAKARAAGGVDYASLAGNDQSDPFDGFKYCSSAFYCANVGTVPNSIALWNGDLQLGTGGGAGSGVFICTMSPAANIPDAGVTLGGGGPLTIVAPIIGAVTGDYWDVTYSGANDKIVTIDYNLAGGGPKTGLLGFYVLIIHSRSQQNFNNKAIAFDGGDEGTSNFDY